MKQFGIRDLADEFGLTLRTLRFYEGRGLLTPSRQGAARFYSEAQHERLRRILELKAQGWSLTEIRSQLRSGLPFSREQTLAQIDHLRAQRSEIDLAITTLTAQVLTGAAA